MSLEPGEDIGEETHRADQNTYFVDGTGSAVLDGRSNKVAANHMIVIPQETKRNIINKGTTPLKLFSFYAPPAEDPGIKHKTKADAEGIVTEAVEAVKQNMTDLAPAKRNRTVNAKRLEPQPRGPRDVDVNAANAAERDAVGPLAGHGFEIARNREARSCGPQRCASSNKFAGSLEAQRRRSRIAARLIRRADEQHFVLRPIC